MYTSYFGNRRNFTNPLIISGKPPYWFKGPHYPKLGPKESFLKDYKAGKIDEEGYIEQYTKLVLDPLDAKETYQEIIDTYGEDVTLLCYEKPPKFCHRHIVALWFEAELGVKVTELGFGPNGDQTA